MPLSQRQYVRHGCETKIYRHFDLLSRAVKKFDIPINLRGCFCLVSIYGLILDLVVFFVERMKNVSNGYRGNIFKLKEGLNTYIIICSKFYVYEE